MTPSTGVTCCRRSPPGRVAGHFDWRLLGFAPFGVGAFFWVVMTTPLVFGLATRPSLPDALVTTKATVLAELPARWVPVAGADGRDGS